MIDQNEDGVTRIYGSRAGSIDLSEFHQFIGWVCLLKYDEDMHIGTLHGVTRSREKGTIRFVFSSGISVTLAFNDQIYLDKYR